MKYNILIISLLSALLMACGGGGGSSKNIPNNVEQPNLLQSSSGLSKSQQSNSESSKKSQSSSGSSQNTQDNSDLVNSCRDIKPVCTVSVSPATSLTIRFDPNMPLSVEAKCNTHIDAASWVSTYGRENSNPYGDLGIREAQPFTDIDFQILFSPLPGMLAYTIVNRDFDPYASFNSRLDHPVRFNYANCAGGGQVDFCFFSNGSTYSGVQEYITTSRCGSPINETLENKFAYTFDEFKPTGEFLLGSRVVAPDLMFPDLFTAGATSGTWITNNVNNNGSNSSNSGSTSSLATVIAGNDVECAKASAVLKTQVCTSIQNQVGICSTNRQSSKCFREVLSASNGCLSSNIESLKQLIRDSDQSAKDVCVDVNTSSSISSKSLSSDSKSSSAACRSMFTILPEDLVANQQTCECGGGVFSKTSTSWLCKYPKTSRGCSKGSDGKWQCGVGD